MADNIALPATGSCAADEVTYSGDASQKVQLVRFVQVTGAEGSKTVVDLPGDAANGLDVDVTRLPALAAGTNNIGDVDVLTLPTFPAGTNYIGRVRLTDGTNDAVVSSVGGLAIGGAIAHDGVDSGNPVKLGGRALAHGTNPTAVAAADRTDWLFNRAGVPFVIGGHPNIISYTHTAITTALTDVALVTVAAGLKIVVTAITVTLDNASTVFPSVRIGFGAVNTPALGANGVILAHGGVPAGGGVNRGDGSGILGIGADDQDLRITTVGVATGGGLQVTVTYYTIES